MSQPISSSLSELFAAAPDIVQPIALDFDAKGRLLVVESHTHFPPGELRLGPKADRIRVFEDTNGDGKADKITTFYEKGTTARWTCRRSPRRLGVFCARMQLKSSRASADTEGHWNSRRENASCLLETPEGKSARLQAG